MTKVFLAVLIVISGPAFAKESKNYNTHFVSPVVDERINFTSCVVSGALISILQNEASDTYCCGTLVTESGKQDAREICALKTVKQESLAYMEIFKTKLVSSVGEQGGGEEVFSIHMVALNKDLKKTSRSSRSTLRYLSSWDYSEGGTYVSGKLPGQIPFSGTLVGLESVDEDLEHFARELGQ